MCSNFQELLYALKIFNYFFTAVFFFEAFFKLVALGLKRYISDRYVSARLVKKAREKADDMLRSYRVYE